MVQVSRGQRSKLRKVSLTTSKEIVDVVLNGQAAGTTTTVAIASAVNTYSGGIGTCPIGSHIRSINVQVSYSSETATNRIDWLIRKNPGDQLGTTPAPGATGGSSKRRFNLHEEKGWGVDSSDGVKKDSMQLMIPKRFQRMGEQDEFQFMMHCPTGIYNVCAKFIYKWVS